MTEEQFYEIFASTRLEFEEFYKYRASYVNRDVGIRVLGTVSYRDTLCPTSTVKDIYQLGDFNFEFLN